MINAGKMAVVLEIEISEPFDCRGWDSPSCDQAQVDRELDEMYRARRALDAAAQQVRQPAHRRALRRRRRSARSSTPATTPAPARSGARETCTGPLHDNTIETGTPAASAASATGADQRSAVQRGAAPVYPPAPHCNTRGLTELGSHVVAAHDGHGHDRQPRPHEPGAASTTTLTLLESRNYSGVISPHGWMDPGNWPRLWKLGGHGVPGPLGRRIGLRQGVATVPAERDAVRVRLGLRRRPRRPVARSPGAERARSPTRSRASTAPSTFDRQKTGDRTFDYSKDGVAHYGLYADWFEDLRARRRRADRRRPVGRRRGLPARCGSARSASRARTASPPAGR